MRILPEGVVSKNDMGALTILQSIVSCMVLGGRIQGELLLLFFVCVPIACSIAPPGCGESAQVGDHDGGEEGEGEKEPQHPVYT